MQFTLSNTNRPTTIGYQLYWFLFQPYKWLIFVPFLGLCTVFFSLHITFIILFINNPSLAGYMAVLWARLNSWVGMMSVSVSGKANTDPNQSYIIVSNHQSLFDILVIYGWLGIDLRWVMKQELRKVPVLGYSCEKLEHIYIDRSNARSAIASLNAAQTRIVNGTSVIFFPEGRRSKTEELLPFKVGAFRMAIDMGLPILPVTISGTKDILPRGSVDLMPGRAKLVIHEPIATTDYQLSTVKELVAVAENRIKSGLKS